MSRHTCIAAAVLALMLPGGCGGPSFDSARIAQQAWQFDDAEGTLSQFREAYPNADARLERVRHRGTINYRPDFHWIAEAELAHGHLLRATRIVRRADIGADGASVSKADDKLSCDLASPRREIVRQLTAEEFRQVVATRGEADALRAIGIELDVAPPDQTALRGSLAAIDPQLNRLCAAFPGELVDFDRNPFSSYGNVSVFVQFGPSDEHGLSPYHVHAIRYCTLSADGRTALPTEERPMSSARLTRTTTRRQKSGGGHSFALHDTKEADLTAEQLDELIAAEGDLALLDRWLNEAPREWAETQPVGAARRELAPEPADSAP